MSSLVLIFVTLFLSEKEMTGKVSTHQVNSWTEGENLDKELGESLNIFVAFKTIQTQD